MSETLTEGLTLLAIGMGFVLSFLCILIAAMHIMSSAVGYLNKIFPEQIETTERKRVSENSDDNTAIAIALAAAVAKR